MATMLRVWNAVKCASRPTLANPTRASSSAAAAYPFSNAFTTPSPPPNHNAPELVQGKGLMEFVSENLIPSEKRHMIDVLFSRRHPDRVPPGSVLSVNLNHAPFSFSGVLISLRRRGQDTSFSLRNVVQRIGVEMHFKVNSPNVTSITVVQRANGGKKGGKRMRRAKLFYLRDSPEKMSRISAGVRR